MQKPPRKLIHAEIYLEMLHRLDVGCSVSLEQAALGGAGIRLRLRRRGRGEERALVTQTSTMLPPPPPLASRTHGSGEGSKILEERG
jgi:hypothetical protein